MTLVKTFIVSLSFNCILKVKFGNGRLYNVPTINFSCVHSVIKSSQLSYEIVGTSSS